MAGQSGGLERAQAFSRFYPVPTVGPGFVKAFVNPSRARGLVGVVRGRRDAAT
jgi:hypothetical protein